MAGAGATAGSAAAIIGAPPATARAPPGAIPMGAIPLGAIPLGAKPPGAMPAEAPPLDTALDSPLGAPPEPPPESPPGAGDTLGTLPPAEMRRIRSAGVGRSDTWHSRISTISAAARRSGAASTSPTPFSSICQARARAGTLNRSASDAPRVRSASGSSWLSRNPGIDFSRVTVCSSSNRSCSIVPRSAPRSCARSVIARAAAGLPPITDSSRSNTASRSDRPSMSATCSTVIRPSAWAIAWSSIDSPSRTEPSAARAIRSKAAGSMVTPSLAAMRAKCWCSSATRTRRRSKRWQRDRTVIGTFRNSVVANTNFTCGGGSSKVFNSALKALRDSIWTSSMTKTLVRACMGRKRVASMISRTSSTPVRLAASISTTSGWRSARIPVQLAQTPQGSAVGPPDPSGPVQFKARAIMRAVVVLPTPRTPVSMNACATRPVANALRRMRTIASCPIRSSKIVGRYFRASTRYGVACTGSGIAMGSDSPNSPGPSGGGGGGSSSGGSSWNRPDMRAVFRRRSGGYLSQRGGRPANDPGVTRRGCFLPDLTRVDKAPVRHRSPAAAYHAFRGPGQGAR